MDELSSAKLEAPAPGNQGVLLSSLVTMAVLLHIASTREN